MRRTLFPQPSTWALTPEECGILALLTRPMIPNYRNFLSVTAARVTLSLPCPGTPQIGADIASALTFAKLCPPSPASLLCSNLMTQCVIKFGSCGGCRRASIGMALERDVLDESLCDKENVEMAKEQNDVEAFSTKGAGSSSSAEGLRIVSATVAGLQSTMGSAMQKMTATMKQSLNMMNSMNSCMEDYVKSGLVLRADVSCPSDAGNGSSPSLTVVARNAGKVPLAGLTLSILVSSSDLASIAASITQLDKGDAEPPSKRRRTAEHEPLKWCPHSEATWNVAEPHPVGNEGHLTVAGPFDLAPGDSRRSTLSLAVPTAALEVRLTASFPSPGTGSALSVQKRGAVRMLHHCRPVWLAPPLLEKILGDHLAELKPHGRVVGFASPGGLRKVFSVPEREGLPVGAGGVLYLADCEVAVIRIIDDVSAEEGEGKGGQTGVDGEAEVEVEKLPVEVVTVRGLGEMVVQALALALSHDLGSLAH